MISTLPGAALRNRVTGGHRRRSRRGRWLVLAVAACLAGQGVGIAAAGAQPVLRQSVHTASSSSGGYWLATADGSVFPAGEPNLGGTMTTSSNPVVGIAATRDGGGYWLVEADGNVIAFGTARLHGTLPGFHVHVSDIVALAPTGDDGGYWLIGRDGGEFAFGDAHYHGSLPGLHVRVSNIVGMVATSDGGGYWLVGSDGGVFAFGNARYVGSLPGIHVRVNDIRAMIPSPTRHGYVLVGADGGAFVFGTGVGYYGSLPGRKISTHDIVGLALTQDARGYWMAGANSATYAFGDAAPYPAPSGISNHLPVVAIAGAPLSKTPDTTTEAWVIQNTPVHDDGSQLNAVHCTQPANCMAVGYYTSRGTNNVFAESWNGSIWSTRTPPLPGDSFLSELQGVSCPTSAHCTAVGWFQNSQVVDQALVETWNGSDWSYQLPPNPAGSSETRLTAVSCRASNACTAVGLYRNQGGTVLTLAESFNGSSWSIESTPNPGGAILSELTGVSCPTIGSCTAVGNFTNSNNTEVTLGEQSSGRSWSLRNTVVPSAAQAGSLSGVDSASVSACIAVGDYVTAGGNQTTLADFWNGSSWSVTPTPGVSGSLESVLEGVSCVSGSDCTAVGWYANARHNTLTIAAAWNGADWSSEPTQNPSGALESYLSQVSCASILFCTAVGNQINSTDTDLPLAEQWVRDIGTYTTVTASSPHAVTGMPITITAHVTATESEFGTPPGTVTFTVTGSKGGSVTCSGGNSVAVSGGTARCNIPAGELLANQGSYSVRASYAGASDFKASATNLSPALAVAKDATSLTLATSAHPAVYGQPITLTAVLNTVSPGSGNPTGAISFAVDGRAASCSGGASTPVGRTAIKATCTIPKLAVGTHSVVATYAGDSNFLGASNSTSPLSQVVNKDATTLTLASNARPAVYSQTITLTAVVNPVAPGVGLPTGAISFTLDGRPAPCNSGVNTPVNTTTLQATCTIRAYLAVGTYSAVATYSGDANFLASSNAKSPLSQVVTKDGTTLVITSTAPNPSPYGDEMTFVATVKADAPGTAIPTGSVTFTVDGEGQCDDGTNTFTLEGGQAGCPIQYNIPLGQHSIVGTYSGDSNFLTSSNSKSPFVASVVPAGSKTALNAPDGLNPPVGFDEPYDAVVTIDAPSTAQPVGNVTFTYSVKGVVSPLECNLGNSQTNVIAVAFNSTNDDYEADCTAALPEINTYTVSAVFSGTGFTSSTSTLVVKTHGT